MPYKPLGLLILFPHLCLKQTNASNSQPMPPFYLQTTKVKALGANIKKKTKLGQPLKPNQWSVSQENHTQVTAKENNSIKKKYKKIKEKTEDL